MAWPFSRDIRSIGFPFTACNVQVNEIATTKISSWTKRLAGLQSTKLRGWLASQIISAWNIRLDKSHPLSSNAFKDLLDARSRKRVDYIWLEGVFEAGVPLPISNEWFEILNEVGKEELWMASEGIAEDYVEEILHRFSTDPERWRGLLNVILELAGEGAKCHLPRSVLQTIRGWGARGISGFLILSFGRDDLSDAEINSLSDEIVVQESVSSVAGSACRVAAHTSAELSAKLALYLLEKLTATDAETFRAIENSLTTLVNFLTKIPSGLTQPDAWARLHLPERV
jgi:hypothetical protein